MTKNINNLLIPNITKLPGDKAVDPSNKLKKGNPSEFSDLLKEQIGSGQQVNKGISLSTHAAKRLSERKIDIDSNEYMKLQDAIQKLKSKGGKESLVITGKAAYIIDIPKNKIITAIDKGSLAENVFTKIDSTLIVN
jgi:flagellar operon protein